MSSQSSTSSRGVTFGGLLGIVFIVLKLTGVIDWSWWWVTCPLWGGFAIVITIFLSVVVFGTIISLFKR